MDKDLKGDLGTLGTIGDRARTAEQANHMMATVGQGKCPFCYPQTKQWKYPAIEKFGRWTLKKNDFPYKNHDHHFVITFESHTNDITQVTEGDWGNFGTLLKWTLAKFGITGGGFAMRFGHSDYNASTVRHLHAHIQAPSKKIVLIHQPMLKLHEECNCQICKLKKVTERQLFVSDNWTTATPCNPLAHHKKHVVIAYNKKTNSANSIETLAWVEFGRMIKESTKGMKGGGITLRFGDAKFHGGFPGHVYCDVVEPDLTGPSRAIFLADSQTGKPICKATFCKDRSPEEEARRKKRKKELNIS